MGGRPPVASVRTGRRLLTAAASAPTSHPPAATARVGRTTGHPLVTRNLSKAILARLLKLPKGEQPELPMDALFRVSILGVVQENSEQEVGEA